MVSSCSLCRGPLNGDNNPAPILNSGRCCDACNNVVIVVRIAQMRPNAPRLNRRNWITAIRNNTPDIQAIRRAQNLHIVNYLSPTERHHDVIELHPGQ